MSDRRWPRSEASQQLAKVIPLRRLDRLDEYQAGRFEQLARQIGATLNELVASADHHGEHLSAATRHAALLLTDPHALAIDGAEPEDLAEVLEASNVGPLTLQQLEEKVMALGARLPISPATELRWGVLREYRRVVRLLEGSQPVEQREHVCMIAAQLAGMAGRLSFDLNDLMRAGGYYGSAMEASRQAGDPVVSAWILGNMSYLLAYKGDKRAALSAAQAASDLVGRTGRRPTSQLAWLKALEAELHAYLGDAQATLRALRKAERAPERSTPDGRRPGIDFFTETRLAAYAGSCFMLLRQPKLAERFSAEALSLLTPAARSRSFVQFDLATVLVQQGELPEGCNRASSPLNALSEGDWTPRLVQRATDFRQVLAPFERTRVVKAFDEQFGARLRHALG